MTDSLVRLTSALADRYRIERELGQGGMATVYLAEDLRHGRKVAVKVLRPDLAAVIGAERFLREIRTIAALQHPHILGLIDSGEVEGTAYFVMPFVEGESLRDRLTRQKQLPMADAVRIAGEVAGALDYAHRHGVIHRDIKPENILLHDGSALVADFGIALAVSAAGGTRITETGLSLGTPHYMSPEQAMGEREISPASDVYALGCVTYEMLTGEPPFTGATVQAIIAKMMTEKPLPPSRVRDTVPPAVEDAVLRALAKLPADRWGSAAEFARAMEGGSAEVRKGGTVAMRAVGRRRRPWLLVGALIAASVLAAAGWWRAAQHAEPAVLRFGVVPAAGSQVAYPFWGVAAQMALSPDGRQAVYTASHGTASWSLDIRNLSDLEARTLPGTEKAMDPAFSPDGRWIAFAAADGTLRKIATDGTGLTTLGPLDPAGSVGITWLSSREIVFARWNLAARGLWKIPADGGQAVQFSRLDSATGEKLQLAPEAADGGRLIFYSSSRASNQEITIGVVIAATGVARLLPGLRGARALGLAAGHLVYVRADGALMAAPFDTRTLKAGDPTQIFDSVAARGWMAAASLSASGSLLYQRGVLVNRVVRRDRHGATQVLMDSARGYAHPRLSPDGRRLAVEVQGGSSSEIWVADLAGRTAERLTRDAFDDRPEWSPDGARIIYSSTRTPIPSLWWQPSDGSGAAELFYQGKDAIREGVFTSDGRSLVFRDDTRDNNRDIQLLPLASPRVPRPLLTSPDDDKEPRISTDSRWLAYVSNASGREEVYVRALEGAGGRVAVSSGGGGEPLWSRDGRHLYYRAGPALMQATLATSPALAVTARDTVFQGPYATDIYHPGYDVSPDDQSFIMLQPDEQARQLVMVVNWTAELRRRFAASR